MLIQIQQRTLFDCSIATAAMVANVVYEDAAAHSPVAPIKRGLYPRQVLDLLESVTNVRWHGPCFAWYRRVLCVQLIDAPAVLVIKKPWWRKYHCIAVQGQWIHDPTFARGYRRTEYPRRQWRVVNTYIPAVPADLQQSRHKNWRRLYRKLEHHDQSSRGIIG